MKRYKPFLSYKKTFWCRIGLHDWYHGFFSYPVWGRFERHCLDCNKKQHRVYKPKLGWKTFKID